MTMRQAKLVAAEAEITARRRELARQRVGEWPTGPDAAGRWVQRAALVGWAVAGVFGLSLVF